MIGSIKSKLNLKADSYKYKEYRECINDLIQTEVVCSMKSFIQHSDITCLEHCIFVSYYSYKICRFLKLDYCSTARGALLHDLFLYDWHTTKPKEGLHGFTHPYEALKNANKYFILNNLEKDIIEKHMWPLTLKLPKYKESFVVLFVDKFCAMMEIIKFGTKSYRYKFKKMCNIVANE